MEFDIANVKFHLKIYIELDFGDNEFYTKFDFNKLDFVKIEFKKQRHFAKHWKSSKLLEVIHSDICGPLRTKTHKGIEYFIAFIDDYS